MATTSRGLASSLSAFIALAAVAVLVVGCASKPSALRVGDEPLRLKHLGTSVVQRASDGLTTDFGGISGMDRDPATGIWYLLSDDRSDRAPARVYTASITSSAAGAPLVTVTGVVHLLQPDGGRFRAVRQGGRPPDPEALRLDPRTGDMLWSSEADRRLGIDSFVRQTDRGGRFVGEIPIPPMLRSHPNVETGGRGNLTVEGLAFSADGSALWLAMEAPIFEDGPPPTQDAGAMARFTKVDRNGKVLAQYAYPVDRIPVVPTGGKRRSDNGVSEILALGDDSLLVLERAGYEVDELVFRFAVRVYEVRVGDASNVSQMVPLVAGGYKPMTKRLVLDLNAAGLGEIDNLEAAAWGPCLAPGRASLLLASDDNFAPKQVNQFMWFEATGAVAKTRCP